MKPLHIFLSLTVFLLFASCQNTTEPVESAPSINEEAIIAEVQATQQELFEAFKQGDYERAMSMHVNSPQYRNISDQIRTIQEVKEFADNLKSEGFKSVDYQAIETSFNILGPDMVIETATLSTSIEMDDGTMMPAIPGFATILYQKIDGSWKLGHVHVTDFPPES